MNSSKFDWIIDNIKNKTSGRYLTFPHQKKSMIIEVGDSNFKVKIGIIGLTTKETPTSTNTHIEELKEFRKLGSRLQGHPDIKKLPGVDMSAGSLGQGLSSACGMAIANKLKKNNDRVYCILGDGEIEEGQVWEAAMTASHYKLDNLSVIIDNNNLQIDGKIEDVLNPYPIDKKFESFGFEVLKADGHNVKDLINVFESAKNIKGKPVAIIAKTVKGKGVSYMEDKAEWHGKAPNEEQYNQAINELE